ADAALALRFGNDVQRQRGLARRFGPEDLYDTALGQAADAESNIEPQRAGGDGFHLDGRVFTQPHDGALAEITLNLAERGGKRLVLVHRSTFNDTQRRVSHESVSLFHARTARATRPDRR